MSNPISAPIVLHKDTDKEQHCFLVNVTDEVTRENRQCVDIYDSHSSLTERVGYKSGMVVMSDGSLKHGDTLLSLTPYMRRLIREVSDIWKQMNYVPEPEVETMKENTEELVTVTSESDNEVTE